MRTISILDIKSFVKIFLSVMLISACAQITIPIQPVPITLQTVSVLLIGLTLKPREAFFAILSYIAIGIAGAPVFAGFNSGLTYFMGFTTGYLIGFLFAAPTMAYVREKFPSSSPISILAICFVGQFILYTFGILWLAKSFGLEKAIAVGLVPFILPGIVKSFILTGLLKAVHILRK